MHSLHQGKVLRKKKKGQRRGLPWRAVEGREEEKIRRCLQDASSILIASLFKAEGLASILTAYIASRVLR